MYYCMTFITRQTTNKHNPSKRVSLLIKSSPPLSLRFANRLSFPPVMVPEALSAFQLCNKTTAINKMETIIKNIFIRIILSHAYTTLS